MLNLEEIYKEIAKLENSDCTTYEVCQKLAILYTVREHYPKKTIATNSPPTTSAMTM